MPTILFCGLHRRPIDIQAQLIMVCQGDRDYFETRVVSDSTFMNKC